nr:antibiotic biosynthesis monooxygenase [uncultured Enterobacter sp.]
MIAVLFEATTAPGKQARYLELAAELKPLLSDIDGFISIERFHSLTTEGKILSLSWWRDENAVLAWKHNVFHRAAQAEGRASIFAAYHIRIAQVLRDYSSQ